MVGEGGYYEERETEDGEEGQRGPGAKGGSGQSGVHQPGHHSRSLEVGADAFLAHYLLICF